MYDEYKEFIVEKGMSADGLIAYRQCPFCGKHVSDIGFPAGFARHVSFHKDHPNWDKIMNGRRRLDIGGLSPIS